MYKIKFKIPEKIKNKKIPKKNNNPLQYLSDIYGLYGIHFFKQITSQILYDLSEYNHNIYRSVINQLTFYGFIFDGFLSKYNIINEKEMRYYLSSNNNIKIKYFIFSDEYLSTLMKRYGLIYKSDLNNLFLQVLIKQAENKNNLFKFLFKSNINIFDEKTGIVINSIKKYEEINKLKPKNIIIKTVKEEMNNSENVLNILEKSKYKVSTNELKEILNVEDELSLYYFINKHKEKIINNNKDSFIKDSFAIDYITLLYNKANSKTLPDNIMNLFKNYKNVLELKEIFYRVKLIRPDIDLNEIEKTLRNNEKFILNGKDKWTLKTSSHEEFEEDLIVTLKNVLCYNKNRRNVDIFFKRIKENETLQSIGEQNDLSRERIRQICNSIKAELHKQINFKRLKPYINIIEDTFKYKKIIPIKDFKNIQNKYFKKLNIKQIINIYELLTSNKIYLIKNKLLSLKNREYIKKRYINLFNGSFGVIELLKFKNVLSDLISREYIYSLIEVSPDLFLCDEKVYLANTKTEMTNLIIKEFYPNGINISEDLDEFKYILNVVFPGYFEGDNDRAIKANFERNNTNLIICDKGKYIDFDNIDIRKEDLIKIKVYILDQLKSNPEIRVHKPYNKFKRYLGSLNIKNKYNLYFTLKEFFGDELYFYKYPRILPNSMREKEVPDNSDLIENFFKVNDGEVSQQRLEQYFINKYCWTREQLINNLNYSDKIIKTDNTNFIHTEYKISIKTNLVERITEEVKNEKNIFYTLNKTELLKFNTSKSARQVFRLIKNSSELILLGLKKDEKIIVLSSNKRNIMNEADFIAYIIDFVFNGIVKSHLLEDYLCEIGFIEKELPRSYKDNKNDLPYIYFAQTFVCK